VLWHRDVSYTPASERLYHWTTLRSISYRILHLLTTIDALAITVPNCQQLATTMDAIITVLKVITSSGIIAMIVLLLWWNYLVLGLRAVWHASSYLFYLVWIVERSRPAILLGRHMTYLTKKVAILDLILP